MACRTVLCPDCCVPYRRGVYSLASPFRAMLTCRALPCMPCRTACRGQTVEEVKDDFDVDLKDTEAVKAKLAEQGVKVGPVGGGGDLGGRKGVWALGDAGAMKGGGEHPGGPGAGLEGVGRRISR